jgi:calcineurin-like phosphoesterase family protein
MDIAMMQNWNKRVSKSDAVYILGDLFFRNAHAVKMYLMQMNGRKHLIIGNHDVGWMQQVDLSRYFEMVTDKAVINIKSQQFHLCHYPVLQWDGMDKGVCMIHGHTHNNINPEQFERLKSTPNILNAGVEINNYVPVTFEELCENNRVFFTMN